MPNTYPTFTQIEGSSETWVDDRSTDRASSGAVKARALFTSKKRKFSIKHVITRAERDTLEAFYDANRVIVFYLVWDGNGVQYVCLFDAAPKLAYKDGLVYVETEIVEQ